MRRLGHGTSLPHPRTSAATGSVVVGRCQCCHLWWSHGGDMIDVRRAGERCRGGEPAAGIETWHAFSFGAHYDPDNVGFGLLSACNEEHLAPGAGFAEHPHRDVEIVTWVVEGVLEHRDSAGHSG